MTRSLALLIAAALGLSLALMTTAQAAELPPGAKWWQGTVVAEDGTKLHADILRPAHLPDSAKTPVILSIGPYFNHAGQTGVLGGVEGTDYDPVGPPEGPSDRFHDLVNGAQLMQRGYTFVTVDLRGFGGSEGCQDWGGPGELQDVEAAIDFAASEPWSDGNVGMYGKSYDGLTGLMGAALRPPQLKAVVSQEPVYHLYRYLYSNKVRYANSLGTPALYDLIAGTPGPLAGDPDYTAGSVNDLQRPGCPAMYWLDQQNDDPAAPYWQERDFIARTKGSTVPVFLTQGFLEDNTTPDGAFEFYNGLAGPKRAWLGMWDHVRGNDTDEDGNLLMGRQGWFDEVVRFYDQHLRGAHPAVADPPIALQTSDGSWRAEDQWPPADTQTLTSTLKTGTYTDDANNNGTGEGAGQGIWTFSPPLAHDAHLAGVPRATLDVAVQSERANLVVDTYDVDPQGSAILVNRGTTRVDESGRVDLELLGNDWKLPAGHRVGVLITSSNSEWWLHAPTFQDVEITSASIALPFLSRSRSERIQGGTAAKLTAYREEAPFTVDAATIRANTSPGFALPPAQTTGSGQGGGSSSGPASDGGATSTASAAPPARAARTASRVRLSVRLVRRGRRLVASGRAPNGALVGVKLRRGASTVAARNVRARKGAFRVTFAARRAGRYRATAATLSGPPTSARSRTLVLRRR